MASAVVLEMVERAVGSCSDPLMHEILYAALYDSGNLEQLLTIRTVMLEKFLHERYPTLLYRLPICSLSLPPSLPHIVFLAIMNSTESI